MLHQINLEYFFDQFPENENPFLVLSNGLKGEIYGGKLTSIEYGLAITFSVLMALTCLGSLIALSGKFYRGDRWFYKLQSTSQGSSLIVPNMINNYLLYSFQFSLISIFYVFFAWIKINSDLHSTPLLLTFTSIPLFSAILHVVWESAVGYYSRNSPGISVFTPHVFNVSFVGLLVLVPLSLIPTTLIMNARFNSGFDAYLLLNAALNSPQVMNVTVSQEFASSGAVRLLIPHVDTTINRMVEGLYQLDDPTSEIGGSFSFLIIVIMLIMTYYQLKSINVQSKSLDSVSNSVGSGESARSRELDLKYLYKRTCIVATLVCNAMFAYLLAAIIGDEIVLKSPVLQLPQGSGVFASLLYFLSIINAVIVGTELYQTFTLKVRRTSNLTSFPIKSIPHSPKPEISLSIIPTRSFSIDLHARRNSRSIEKDLENSREGDEEAAAGGNDLKDVYLPPYPPTSPGFVPSYSIASYHLDGIADRKM